MARLTHYPFLNVALCEHDSEKPRADVFVEENDLPTCKKCYRIAAQTAWARQYLEQKALALPDSEAPRLYSCFFEDRNVRVVACSAREAQKLAKTKFAREIKKQTGNPAEIAIDQITAIGI